MDATQPFRIGPWEVDPATCRLKGKGGNVRIENKAMEVLAYLARHPGEVVPRDTLLQAVWSDVTVTDHVLTVAISNLRRALGDNARTPTYIATVPRRGFRLVAPVEPLRRHERHRSTSPVKWPAAAAALLIVSILIGAFALVSWTRTDRRTTTDDASVGTAEAAYGKGQLLLERAEDGDVARAFRYFERAASMAPTFAPAWSGMAHCYLLDPGGLGKSRTEAFREATHLARRAHTLDPQLADAQAALGALAFRHEWRWDVAEARLRQALEGDPNAILVHQWLAELLSATGRHEDAEATIRRAMALDPVAPGPRYALAWALFVARRYDESLAALATLDEAERQGAGFHWMRFDIEERRGNAEVAIEAYVAGVIAAGFEPESVLALRRSIETEGIAALHRWRLEHAHELFGRPRVARGWRAAVHLALGEADRALALLEEAFGDREPFVTWVVVDPRFDGLRQHPRFIELVARLVRPSLPEAS